MQLAVPFDIGGLRIPNRVVLAPMAGVTSGPFRRLVKRYGVGLVVTEMVSAYGIFYGDRRTASYLAFTEQERPLAVQLFGDTPHILAEAARSVLSRSPRPDLIDLNMGCPVRKVVKTGAGSALIDRPEAAAELARAVVEVGEECGVPVTAKIRSGRTATCLTAVELARRLEEAGVAAVAVHPRTAEQQYSGRADHSVTAEVVAAVSIPVIASGDVFSLEAAERIWTESGAAAVMVGRGVRGNPWLVQELLKGEPLPRPSLSAVTAELSLLLEMAGVEMGPERATRWLRGHLSWFLRPAGVPGRVVDGLRRLPDARSLNRELARLGESAPGAVQDALSDGP
jgi:tRNA-dihydrouridine synthase B